MNVFPAERYFEDAVLSLGDDVGVGGPATVEARLVKGKNDVGWLKIEIAN